MMQTFWHPQTDWDAAISEARDAMIAALRTAKEPSLTESWPEEQLQSALNQMPTSSTSYWVRFLDRETAKGAEC
jgi:hypothetical protein